MVKIARISNWVELDMRLLSKLILHACIYENLQQLMKSIKIVVENSDKNKFSDINPVSISMPIRNYLNITQMFTRFDWIIWVGKPKHA